MGDGADDALNRVQDCEEEASMRRLTPPASPVDHINLKLRMDDTELTTINVSGSSMSMSFVTQWIEATGPEHVPGRRKFVNVMFEHGLSTEQVGAACMAFDAAREVALEATEGFLYED